MFRGKKAREMVALKRAEIKTPYQHPPQELRSSMASAKYERLEVESSRTSRKEGDNVSPDPVVV